MVGTCLRVPKSRVPWWEKDEEIRVVDHSRIVLHGIFPNFSPIAHLLREWCQGRSYRDDSCSIS